MPSHIRSFSRRDFITTTFAGAAALVVRPVFGADDTRDPHRLALVSDMHIPASPDIVNKKGDLVSNMTEHGTSALAEIIALAPKPAGVIVNGDLAHLIGKPEDYAAFEKLIEPVRKAGLPISVAMGNHDSHENFDNALSALNPANKPVAGRHVLILEMERANIFILDSLEKVPGGPGGKFGETQIHWLAKELDARPAKPAIVFGHHNLQDAPKPDGSFSGLADTADFWPVLRDRKQVKAYIFGHTHTWKLDVRDDVHLINLPATAYFFAATGFLGWTDAHLLEKGIRLETRGLDTAQELHGKTHEMVWRA